MAANPEEHILVRLGGSSNQLAAYEKGRAAAAVLERVSALAGY